MISTLLPADAAEGTEEKWQPVSSPAPPPDPQAAVLVDTDLDVSVHDFYKEILSDKVHRFHCKLSHSMVNIIWLHIAYMKYQNISLDT